MGKKKAEKKTTATLWMEVSKDRYELPLIVADSYKDIAEFAGVSPATVRSSASNKNTKFKRFVRVVVS